MKYPKFFTFFLTVIVAYLIFSSQSFSFVNNFLVGLSYLGIFIAGIMYVYSFTSAPATSLLLIFGSFHENLFLVGLIAGLGSLVGDLLIYFFVKSSFDDELKLLKKSKYITLFNNRMSKKFKKYVLPILGVIVVASPLPDEIGVTLLAASKKINLGNFTVLSYILNTTGILIILTIGSII